MRKTVTTGAPPTTVPERLPLSPPERRAGALAFLKGIFATAFRCKPLERVIAARRRSASTGVRRIVLGATRNAIGWLDFEYSSA